LLLLTCRSNYHVTDILRHELGKLRKTASMIYRRQLPKDSILSTKFEVPYQRNLCFYQQLYNDKLLLLISHFASLLKRSKRMSTLRVFKIGAFYLYNAVFILLAKAAKRWRSSSSSSSSSSSNSINSNNNSSSSNSSDNNNSSSSSSSRRRKNSTYLGDMKFKF
jgi:hypothetical protein